MAAEEIVDSGVPWDRASPPWQSKDGAPMVAPIEAG
jgi:hypothetical protein